LFAIFFIGVVGFFIGYELVHYPINHHELPVNNARRRHHHGPSYDVYARPAFELDLGAFAELGFLLAHCSVCNSPPVSLLAISMTLCITFSRSLLMQVSQIAVTKPMVAPAVTGVNMAKPAMFIGVMVLLQPGHGGGVMLDALAYQPTM
jgi:hypothetical protein